MAKTRTLLILAAQAGIALATTAGSMMLDTVLYVASMGCSPSAAASTEDGLATPTVVVE